MRVARPATRRCLAPRRLSGACIVNCWLTASPSFMIALPWYNLAVGSLKASFCTFLGMGRPGHDVMLADLTSFGTRRLT